MKEYSIEQAADVLVRQAENMQMDSEQIDCQRLIQEHAEMLDMLEKLQYQFCFPDNFTINETVELRLKCRDLILKVKGE